MTTISDGGRPRAGRVTARTEKRVIPTFTISKGMPSATLFDIEETKSPYPRSMLDTGTRSSQPIDREYTLYVIESDLMRVEVLPEVGGRVWSIIYKRTGRNLLWTNDCIKPVDAGRRRGWIEGSIEFPFPVSNHGQDTMEPYRASMRQGADGSATVTVGHYDHFYRFWGSYDITLNPYEARVAITVRLHNPTPVRNRYQIWINGAVDAGDDMQFVFPVDYVAGHGFGGVHPWPMWDDGAYDRSFWKNQAEQLGVFGWGADFLGVYYHKSDCGTLRWCDHNEAEGIKMWTWGTASNWTAEYSIGKPPCVEIQWGRWPTQEMYGWLEPHSTDTWTEYWYPVTGTGGVDHATAEVALSLELGSPGRAAGGAVHLSSAVNIHGTLEVRTAGRPLCSEKVEMTPGKPLKVGFPLGGLGGRDVVAVTLTDESGRTVISYERPLARPAAPQPAHPKNVRLEGEGPEYDRLRDALSSELLDGNPFRARSEYEALVREHCGFAEGWKALGILAYKQLDDTHALQALVEAAKLAPDDIETLHYLGLVRLETDEAQAEDTLLEVVRLAKGDASKAHLGRAAAVLLGKLMMRRGRVEAAFELLTDAGRGSSDPIVWDLTAMAARLCGRLSDARDAVSRALVIEPLDPVAAALGVIMSAESSAEDAPSQSHMEGAAVPAPHAQSDLSDRTDSLCAALRAALGEDDELYMDVAFLLASAGDAKTALTVAQAGAAKAFSPLYTYRLAWLAQRTGDEELARRYAREADGAPSDYVFPCRREDFEVFDHVGRWGAHHAYATYHQATLLYWLGRRSDALDAWVGLVGKYDVPGLYRKVADALGSGRISGAYEGAIDMYRRALSEDPHDAEVYGALDDLYEKTGDFRGRTELLERARRVLPEDDGIALRMARCHAWRRRFEEAAAILEGHAFHRAHQSRELMWLGRRAIEETYTGLALAAMARQDTKAALAHLSKALEAEGKLKEWFD